jgi:hypothetical protein
MWMADKAEKTRTPLRDYLLGPWSASTDVV